MNPRTLTIAAASLAAVLALAPAACRRPQEPAMEPSRPAAKAPAVAPALLEPAKAVERAPDTFKARFATTKGDFVIEVTRAWAPAGADRFYNLVKLGYFDNVAFFRVVEGFMAQFGINGSPQVNANWRTAAIPDDPPKGISNTRGQVTYAMGGPNTRTTQLFINYKDNSNLDPMGFTPFGRVVEGMETVDSLYAGYGDGPPYGTGPHQGRVQTEGNAYLKDSYPKLDYVKTARLEP